MDALEKERLDLIEKNQKLQIEISKLKANLREYVITNANETEKAKDLEKIYMERERSLLNQIEDQKNLASEAYKHCDTKDMTITKLTYEIAEQIKVIQRQENEMKDLSNQIQSYSKGIDDLHSVILSHKSEIFQLRNELAEKINTIRINEDNISKYQAEVTFTKNKAKELIETCNRITKEKEKRLKEIELSKEVLNSEKSQLASLLDETKLELKRTFENNFKTKDENAKLKLVNVELKEKISVLEDDKNWLTKEIERLNEEIQKIFNPEK